MNKNKKIAKIKLYFDHLYLLKAEDIKKVINRLGDLPEEGLDAMLKVLEDGKAKQDDFLKKMNTKDPKFNEGLKKFLRIESKRITDAYTAREQDEESEKILEQIN